mmetsp:Transcript_41812/g.75301  ORF Transcript_41812/g.75301 Transcript_41812/m.75301 type:complete len:658 (-) Transcript_41812:118-2091(-)
MNMKFASLSLAAAILAESSTAQIPSHPKRLRSFSVEQVTDDLETASDFPPGYFSMPKSMSVSISMPMSMPVSAILFGTEQELDSAIKPSKRAKSKSKKPPNPPGPPTVDVPGLGMIVGQDRPDDTSLVEFLGIPYAKAPTGPLRWQPPQEYDGWDGTFEATDYGKACTGLARGMDGKPNGQTTGDEDCLFLDIIAPQAALDAGKKMRSVLVYFHEGGFLRGSGSEYASEMAALVASSGGEVIGVLVNYRLGVFGLLGGRDVGASTGGAGSGNFAIMDQRMAMSWVKSNIRVFGGDQNDVTIFGHSAGGQSVLHHLVQPQSFSLYNKAIIQSGTYDQTSISLDEADIIFNTMVGAVAGFFQQNGMIPPQCTDPAQKVACLNLVPAGLMYLIGTNVFDSFRPVLEGYPSSTIPILLPTVDGVSLPDSPSKLFETKQYNNNVPVIIGSTLDEYSYFLERDGIVSPLLTEDEFDKLVPYSEMTPEMLAEVKEVYANVTESENYSKFYGTHVRYAGGTIPFLGHCSDRWLARTLVAGGTPAVYTYQFSQEPNLRSADFASHISDIPYTFDRVPADSPYNPNLGKIMSAYWYGFATSKHNKPKLTKAAKELGGIKWHEFTEDEETTLIFEAGGVRMQEDLDKEACDWQFEQFQARGGFPTFMP